MVNFNEALKTLGHSTLNALTRSKRLLQSTEGKKFELCLVDLGPI
jgi:hypothetical protein